MRERGEKLSQTIEEDIDKKISPSMISLILYTVAMLLCFVLLASIVDKFFVVSLDRIRTIGNLSSDAAGATLMAVGSSAPELFVALFAVIKPGDHDAIGIGQHCWQCPV